jgi:hypothetical protein
MEACDGLRNRLRGPGRQRICGSPDTAIKQLERIQKEAQLDQLLAMMQFWLIPHEKTMHAIDLFGKYVIPHFRDRQPMESESRHNP